MTLRSIVSLACALLVVAPALPCAAEAVPLPRGVEDPARTVVTTPAHPVVSATTAARAHVTATAPREPSPASRVVAPAVIGGALLVGGWAGAAIGAATSLSRRRCVSVGPEPGYEYVCSGSSRESGLALVPIVGPFLAAGRGLDPGLAVITGLGEVIGALTLAIGIPLSLASDGGGARLSGSVAPGVWSVGLDVRF